MFVQCSGGQFPDKTCPLILNECPATPALSIIDKSRSPKHTLLIVNSDAGRNVTSLKLSIAIVVVKDCKYRREVGFENVDPSRPVIIGNADAP